VWVNSEAAQCRVKLECSRKGKTVLQQLEVIHVFVDSDSRKSTPMDMEARMGLAKLVRPSDTCTKSAKL
jgi:acyl-CoA thioesterase FadM